MRTEAKSANGQATEQTADPDFSDFMNGFVVDAKGYLRAETEHLTLHATEKAAILLGKMARYTAVLVALAMVLLFLNLALAFYLGDLLRSTSLGFVIVAGGYLLLLGGFLLWWSKGGRDQFVLDRLNDLTNDEQ